MCSSRLSIAALLSSLLGACGGGASDADHASNGCVAVLQQSANPYNPTDCCSQATFTTAQTSPPPANDTCAWTTDNNIESCPIPNGMTFCCTPAGQSEVNSDASDCCGQAGADVNGNCCPLSNQGAANVTCIPTCQYDQECWDYESYNSNGITLQLPWCAPQSSNGVAVAGPWLCTQAEGQPYGSCYGTTTTCGSGYDCWSGSAGDNNGVGYEICATSCNADSDCNDPGVLCCNTQGSCHNLISSCAGSGFCIPCGSQF